MTFTNRATDELEGRLDRLGVDTRQLWAGTIHGFALDWVIRPYAPYVPELRTGFSVADEFLTERLLRTLREECGAERYLDVSTTRDRGGKIHNRNTVADKIALEYKQRLRNIKVIDYDDILFYAYQLVSTNAEIAATLGQILRLICVDEIQDTQDLQYGLLSAIVKASDDPPALFFVGDLDQSIYESLGSIPKTSDEIAEEFGLTSITSLHLKGNYRSTQRVIDFYQQLRPNGPRIQSLTPYRSERGSVTFDNQSVVLNDVPALVATLIVESLDRDIPPEHICVLAPQWWLVRTLGRALVPLLPDVGLDAPGLSVLHAQRDNFWFKLARLFLTMPNPQMYVSRLRWAAEVARDLASHGAALPQRLQAPRQLLRVVNSIVPAHADGLTFLEEAFSVFVTETGIDLAAHPALADSHTSFFQKASQRLSEITDPDFGSLTAFQRLFRHPSGVVVATCHAVKGEEYETVIAVSLLEGYVPNWDVIRNGTEWAAGEQASKLLYVIASRAKSRLHLIAESGRFTNSKRPYETSRVLRSANFDYDRSAAAAWTMGS